MPTTNFGMTLLSEAQAGKANAVNAALEILDDKAIQKDFANTGKLGMGVTPGADGQVQIHGGVDGAGTEAVIATVFGNKAGLLIVQGTAGTKRAQIAFNDYSGFRMGEDSAQNGTRDFWINNGHVGLMTYKISTTDVHEIGSAAANSAIKLVSAKFAAFNGTPAVKPTVSGSRGGNAALASLLTALAGLGLLTDSSSA